MEAGGRPRDLPNPGEEVDPEARIYARSAGDDKAPAAAIFAALDALADGGISPSSNLRFFFEGEEEAGSRHLGAYMRTHRRQLAADAWLICDGPVHQSRRPQLVFGVRGLAGLEITVYGATRYLHSGHYGNWAPNPAMRLAQLLATMKDEAGDVAIEGFYDSTIPPGEAELRALRSVPHIDAQLRSELGLATTEGGNARLEERLLRPSLNVRGLESAAVGERARNVIPPSATASIDVRLAKGNDPETMLDLVERHVREQGYHLVRTDPEHAERLRFPLIAKVTRRPGYPAARTSIDLPIVEQIIQAAERATAEPLVLLPTMGGSLPLHLFTDLLGAPLIIVPIANHDDNQHAPDENLRLANLWYGIDLMGAIFTMD
jgi:acetylornithine deacetylase/succinyl-diaminopimelate desuccinylase-like protein